MKTILQLRFLCFFFLITSLLFIPAISQSDVQSFSATLIDYDGDVSILKEGTIRINTHSQSHLVFDELHADVIPHNDDKKVLTVKINSGTIEMKDNKLIILAD